MSAAAEATAIRLYIIKFGILIMTAYALSFLSYEKIVLAFGFWLLAFGFWLLAGQMVSGLLLC
ncbi:hypothetical protein [Endozoicomonas euniceicola]|uniref:Uncharacterized protein n=1 Tax=Endozoicomonas euniceicola TaxID=1234143 RepID=A0ABY6H2X6_9GAMM|nr:hypothetical protein [Endozoicomonas euniceicola]UYM18484.1 hypothetical protein NX720_11475 [Endozoicomonas euniceicola]